MLRDDTTIETYLQISLYKISWQLFVPRSFLASKNLILYSVLSLLLLNCKSSLRCWFLNCLLNYQENCKFPCIANKTSPQDIQTLPQNDMSLENSFHLLSEALTNFHQWHSYGIFWRAICELPFYSYYTGHLLFSCLFFYDICWMASFWLVLCRNDIFALSLEFDCDGGSQLVDDFWRVYFDKPVLYLDTCLD